MKNNEYSFEDFFAAGTGNETQESYKISTEGFDGYNDGLFADADQAMEELNFLESFESMSRMNADQKIRMLKKIQNNYNSKTISRENLGYSIESMCNSQIQSLEDAVAAPKEGEAAADKPTEATEKKKGFFKTVFGAITKFFKMIWKAITTTISKFVEWVKHAFAKKAKAETGADQKTDMGQDTAGATSAAGSTGASKAEAQLEKAKIMFDFSKPINVSGATNFVKAFVTLGKNTDAMFAAFDKEVEKAKKANGEATAAVHAENVIFADTARKSQLVIKEAANVVKAVGTNVSINLNSTKVEEVKKAFKEAENSLAIITNASGSGNYDAIYKTVKTMFGLEKDVNFSTKSAEAKARAQKSIESLANFEKNVFIAQCDPVQKKLMEHADNMQKTIDARLSGNKDVNATTSNIMNLQAALKFACKSEQFMSKIFTKLNSCATQYVK